MRTDNPHRGMTRAPDQASRQLCPVRGFTFWLIPELLASPDQPHIQVKLVSAEGGLMMNGR